MLARAGSEIKLTEKTPVKSIDEEGTVAGYQCISTYWIHWISLFHILSRLFI
jgi:hypothetical protein